MNVIKQTPQDLLSHGVISMARCEISDLPSDMCADCIHNTHGSNKVKEDNFISQTKYTGELVIITSKFYNPKCYECQEPIEQGDLIAKYKNFTDSNNQWIHLNHYLGYD